MVIILLFSTLSMFWIKNNAKKTYLNINFSGGGGAGQFFI